MPEKTILELIIVGHYSDWVFNVLLTNLTLCIKNNLALLLLFAGSWVKFSKYTKGKWDDKASNWLMQKLTRIKKEKEKKNEKDEI